MNHFYKFSKSENGNFIPKYFFWSLIASAVNSVSNAIQNEKNREHESEINEKNAQTQYLINRENLDYAKSMTLKQWERDDNAHQREVQDLIDAGLSPLANTTGSTVTPAKDYSGIAPQYTPLYQSNPFSLDTNALIQEVLKNKELNEIERSNRAKEGFKATELRQIDDEISLKISELENRKDEFNRNMIQREIEFSSNLELANKQLAELNRHNMTEENLRDAELQSQEFFKSIDTQLPEGWEGSIKKYTDWNEYVRARERFAQNYSAYLDVNYGIADEYGSRSNKYPNDKTSQSWNFSLGGSGNGAGAGFTIGSSTKRSEDFYKRSWREFMYQNEFPIFIFYTRGNK